MRRFANGDDQAFESLFRRYKDRLYRYLKRLCRNDGIAEELCQDVWERLIKHRDSFDETRSFVTYMFSIAHNRVVDFFRSVSSKSFEEFEDGSHSDSSRPTDHQAFSREQVRRFMQVFDTLSPAQREVFVLHEETSMTLSEIAEVIGVNPETAKSRLRFALLNLRKGMEGYI